MFKRRRLFLRQRVRGGQSVVIGYAVGSPIEITYGGRARLVPLEPAVVPIPLDVSSPSRLVKARSGVVPYTARPGLLAKLERWLATPEPFSARLVAGRGGTGKTRLGVELCVRGQEHAGWLCGLLTSDPDQAALEELVQVPTTRLVVVDYAETRRDQLEFLLPRLASKATSEHPVRVLLLVRAEPRRSQDWREALRRQSDTLDAVVDAMDVDVLEEFPLSLRERRELFTSAASALAKRTRPSPLVPAPPKELRVPAFATPLLVVAAAYLALHDDRQTLTTKAELLDELLVHEDRYWQKTLGPLVADEELRRRVVALATLAGASGEAEAVELLRLVPDLTDASAERLGGLARWSHRLYPGREWWNPLEPDLVAEHLVLSCYRDNPEVLSGVLDGRPVEALVRPLDVLGRAAAENPSVTNLLQPVLTSRFHELCSAAIEQAATETDLDLLLGKTTVGAVLDRAVREIVVDPTVLPALLDQFPSRSDLVLNSLACTLTEQLVTHLRSAGLGDSPQLARWLNNLSVRLAYVGRRAEGLAASEEAVAIYRRLSAANPDAYEPNLAMSLYNLSIELTHAGRRAEGLAASEEAVAIYRRLAAANPDVYEPDLARSLDNLSLELARVGRLVEALAVSEEAGEICDRLAAALEPNLARVFTGLSVRRLALAGSAEGLAATEEAVAIHRQRAAANPAAYEPDLAMSLHNLSIDLAKAGRRAEALAASEEAVAIHRRLAAANPDVYEPDLARSLNNLSNRLADAGRPTEAEHARRAAERLSLRES